jgi:hypothetical protein
MDAASVTLPSLVSAHRADIENLVRRHRGRSISLFGSVARPGFRSWLSGLGAWMPVWARELGSQRAGSRVSRRFGVLGGRFGAVQAGVAGWMLV